MDYVLEAVRPYAKAVAPLVAGLVVFLIGVAVDDDTLKQIGLGAIAASPLVYGVRNR